MTAHNTVTEIIHDLSYMFKRKKKKNPKNQNLKIQPTTPSEPVIFVGVFKETNFFPLGQVSAVIKNIMVEKESRLIIEKRAIGRH